MCKIVKDYRDNIILRHSFNELAKKTFGLDFEDWYQNGFWSDHYNPYSIVEDHKVIANVSVNKTDMILKSYLFYLQIHLQLLYDLLQSNTDYNDRSKNHSDTNPQNQDQTSFLPIH